MKEKKKKKSFTVETCSVVRQQGEAKEKDKDVKRYRSIEEEIYIYTREFKKKNKKDIREREQKQLGGRTGPSYQVFAIIIPLVLLYNTRGNNLESSGITKNVYKLQEFSYMLSVILFYV